MAIRKFKPLKISVGAGRGHAYNSANLRRQLQRLSDNFSKFADHMHDQSSEILVDALTPTFEKSKVYCPKDTHALVNSGYLEVEQSINNSSVVMGYGRNGSPHYAQYVHEIPYPHQEPTRYKWLQAALQEDSAKINASILNGLMIASGMGGA